MTFGFLRALFVCICMITGYQLGMAYQAVEPAWGLLGAGIGTVIALLVIGLEKGLGRVSLRGMSAAVFGLVLAILFSKLLGGVMDAMPLSSGAAAIAKIALTIVMCYLGVIFALRGRDEFNVIIPYVKFQRQDESDTPLILDTSSIVDGRFQEVLQTGFLHGRLIVPKFVLTELQQVADSEDEMKRARGRRGMDLLNKLRKEGRVPLKIHDDDFPNIHSVDEKLVQLAKVLQAKVLTTDYNLNKIAEFQGVPILNVNELAAALKPVVQPGEILEIKLSREGKENNQAVGYLDDGTMVVVDNAKRLIGQSQRVCVTSALQTQSGRMIFAKLESDKSSN